MVLGGNGNGNGDHKIPGWIDDVTSTDYLGVIKEFFRPGDDLGSLLMRSNIRDEKLAINYAICLHDSLDAGDMEGVELVKYLLEAHCGLRSKRGEGTRAETGLQGVVGYLFGDKGRKTNVGLGKRAENVEAGQER